MSPKPLSRIVVGKAEYPRKISAVPHICQAIYRSSEIHSARATLYYLLLETFYSELRTIFYSSRFTLHFLLHSLKAFAVPVVQHVYSIKGVSICHRNTFSPSGVKIAHKRDCITGDTESVASSALGTLHIFISFTSVQRARRAVRVRGTLTSELEIRGDP